MQQTIHVHVTASHSVTVQYLSQLPALNANYMYVNLMVITY